MDIQEYKITNKETGESHFAVPETFGNETVTFRLQDTDEEIVFSNIGSVGNLENDNFTAETIDKSFEEVEAEIAEEVTPEAEVAQIGEDAELEIVEE